MAEVKYNMYFGKPANCLINEMMYKEAFLHSHERDKGKIDQKYNYGEFEGDYDVRKCLAEWYTKDTGCLLKAENIMTNSGASSGIFTCIVELLKPGDNMLIECPSFLTSFNAFLSKGVKLIPAVRDREGTFDFEDLEEKIVKHNIKAFYLVTNYHNPTGINTSLKDRLKIYSLANNHKFYVFSDEIYETNYFNPKSRVLPLIYCNSQTSKGNLEHLKDYDLEQSEYIIAISSFSKSIFPQLRFGFIIAHKDIISRMAFNPFSYLPVGFKNINEHIVRSYIELGYLDKLIQVQREYIFSNISRAITLLSKNPFISFKIPEGGYFIFVYIEDEKVDEVKLMQVFTDKGVLILLGSRCIPTSMIDELPQFKRTIRICFSYIDSELIEEAVMTFNSAFEESLKEI